MKKLPQFVLKATEFNNPCYIAECVDLQTMVTDKLEEAQVYDIRDNLPMKIKFFKAQTGIDFFAVQL